MFSDKPLSLELFPCRGFYIQSYILIILLGNYKNQVPQCVRKVSFGKVHISCHNVESEMKNYQ